jgi:cysteine-rich repeat protein
VYCFGYNHHGELGRGNRSLDSPNYMTGSVAVAGLTDVVEVGGGRHFFCARRSNGTVWGWGYGSHGQSGNGTNTTDGTARQVRGIDDAVALSSGSTGYAMCAARRNGSVWCWGGNWRGQLGTEHNYNTNEPVQMRLRGAMRCGDGELEGNETCDDGNALDSDACLNNCRLSRCGDGYVRNAMEQCDDGNDINNDSCRNDCVLGSCGNARVDAGEFCDDGNTENWDNCPNDCRLQVPDVTAGGHHMCFRRTGKIFCTGRNHYGELGDGSNDDRNVPVVVRNITTAVAHSSGYYHHCAALSSGRVMCWGYGAHGQMGNETYDNSNVPVLVSNITDVEKLGASHYLRGAPQWRGLVLGLWRIRSAG